MRFCQFEVPTQTSFNPTRRYVQARSASCDRILQKPVTIITQILCQNWGYPHYAPVNLEVARDQRERAKGRGAQPVQKTPIIHVNSRLIRGIPVDAIGLSIPLIL